MDHHDPTCAAFVNGVYGVTGTLLLDKKTLRLRDPADESFEFTIRINSCEKMHATDASDISFYLADRRSQQRRPECNFNAGRSLVTDRPNLTSIAVAHCRDDGEHRIDREINERVSAFRLLSDVTRRKMDDANVSQYIGTVDLRQRV